MTIKTCKFRIGDVYLFHATDPGCDSRTSLWGIVGNRDAEDRICLDLPARRIPILQALHARGIERLLF